LQPSEQLLCFESVRSMLDSIQDDYLKWVLFSDESTFHVLGMFTAIMFRYGVLKTHM
jgi:hypothetical protein